MSSRCSLCSILPPYMVEKIAENGTAEQRRMALRTLATDQTLRAMRAAGFPTVPRVHALEAIEVEVNRTIYTAAGGSSLPGQSVRQEGSSPSGDAAVDEAYDGLGATFDLYSEAFDRNSIDDEGLPLVATVHFQQNYDNAFWNGSQMVFGDGDGQLFNRFTIALDVIGHELAHGVTEDEAQLVYFSQPGALNESMSDVFGSLVRQRRLNQDAASADWLIGAGLFTSAVHGVALRSMKAPGTAYDDPVLGKDPQPAHMKDFVRTYDDNGGVHINSGIPNHAFYLAATALGGKAWEKAGHIWYETLRDSRMRKDTGFKRFARLTVDNAGRLYGQGQADETAVRNAWAAVGLAVS